MSRLSRCWRYSVGTVTRPPIPHTLAVWTRPNVWTIGSRTAFSRSRTQLHPPSQHTLPSVDRSTASDAPVQSDSLRYAPVRLPRVRYRRILPRTPPALVLVRGYLPACHAVGFGFEPSGTENFPSSHETILCLPDGVSPPVPVHRAPPRMFRVTYFHGPFRRSSQLVASPKTRRTYPPGFQNPPYSSAVG